MFAAVLILPLTACSARADTQAGRATPEGVPALTGRVVDVADLLAPAAETRIVADLARLEAVARDQLIVVTLPSLNGRPIEEVGLELGRAWGIGRRELDNGVILLVAPNERQVRIEVGTGLEALLTNERASLIIRRDLLPAFRANRFEAGIGAGVSAISAVLRGDTKRPAYKQRQATR